MSTPYALIIEKIVLPMFDLITRSQTIPYMAYLHKTERLDYKDMKAIQTNKLKRVLDNAHQHLEIYRLSMSLNLMLNGPKKTKENILNW